MRHQGWGTPVAAAILLFGVATTAVTASLDARAEDRVVAAASQRQADLVAEELAAVLDRHAELVTALGMDATATLDGPALLDAVRPVVVDGDLLPVFGRDSWISLAVSQVADDGALIEVGSWRSETPAAGATRVDSRRVDAVGGDLLLRLERLPPAPATLWDGGRTTVWLLGLGLTGLLAALVLLVGRSERRAFELADRQTAALQATNRELEQAVHDLEQASQAKDDFLAVVSHEFRTPLTVIQGFASTVLNVVPGELHPTTTDALVRIERHARRLDGLVGDLLTTAQLANGVVVARPDVVELDEVLRDVRELDDTGLVVDAEVGLLALVDRRHLDTMVANLLGNAAKYGAPPTSLTVRSVGTDVELAVQDAGCGVPAHLHDTLFDRFTQAEHGTTRSVSGVGLGLSIVRQLAELNGGSVRHEVPDGGGARFVVTLRAAPSPRRSVRSLRAAPAVTGGGGTAVPST